MLPRTSRSGSSTPTALESDQLPPKCSRTPPFKTNPSVDAPTRPRSNGLLLRTDIHKLFDRGYVTFDNKCCFAVSERSKADVDSGVHYYAM